MAKVQIVGETMLRGNANNFYIWRAMVEMVRKRCESQSRKIGREIRCPGNDESTIQLSRL